MASMDRFETKEVKEINKRELAKIILKYCGNEGNAHDEHEASLRKLLQTTSDYLKKEKPHIWENAEINIYDNEDHALTIISGKGSNAFIVQYIGDTDEVEVVSIKRENNCSII